MSNSSKSRKFVIILLVKLWEIGRNIKEFTKEIYNKTTQLSENHEQYLDDINHEQPLERASPISKRSIKEENPPIKYIFDTLLIQKMYLNWI